MFYTNLVIFLCLMRSPLHKESTLLAAQESQPAYLPPEVLARGKRRADGMNKARRLMYKSPRDLTAAEVILRDLVKEEDSGAMELEMLSLTLSMQNKAKESTHMWRAYFRGHASTGQDDPLNLLIFAKMAQKSGAAWQETHAAYNKAVVQLNQAMSRDETVLRLPTFVPEQVRPADLLLWTHIALIYSYGLSDFGRNEKERAIQEFEGARRIRPNHTLLHLHQGYALLQHRDAAGARRVGTFVLENALDPSQRARAKVLLNRAR